MSLPFFYEDYQLELRHLAQRYMTKPLGFCGLTSVVAHGASVLINIAAIPLVYELLKGNAELYRAEKPFLASLLRGYMTSVFWSPNWVSVAAVTYYLKLPWLAVVPMGLLLTLITIGLSLIWIYLEIHLNPNRYQELENDDQAHIYWPYIYTLIILAASLMSLIVVLNLISTWQILIIAPIAALLFAPVTALLQKKVPKFKKGLHNYYHNTLVRIKSEMTLFTAAGFLGAALKFSGISQALPQYLPYWLNEFPFISILAVMLIIVLPALAGIHPVVAGTAVVSTINPLTLDLTPMIYGGTVLAGWGLAVLVSPFSAMSLVTAGMIGSSSWEIGLKLNGLFGLLLLLSLASALTFIHYMF
jgi:hypothetical protein